LYNLLDDQRKANEAPKGFIDLDGASIEKDEEKWFSIRVQKKAYNLKFASADEKDSWMDLVAKMMSTS
jgi:hypothetical protein